MTNLDETKKRSAKYLAYFCSASGALFIFWGASGYLNIPKESELIEVSGKPTDTEEKVYESRRSGPSRSLTFRIGGHGVSLSETNSHFDEISAIARMNEPITIWLSPKPETSFPITDRVPPYRLERDGKVILTYAESLERAMALVRFMFILGAAFILIGVWSFSLVRWQEKIAALRGHSE